MLERENDWYCMKDDVILQKEIKLSAALQTPSCKVCGRAMALQDEANQRWYCYRDDVTLYSKEERWVGLPTAADTGTYPAFYVDGYADARSGYATIQLLQDSLLVMLTDPERRLEFPYAHVEVLSISHEREITALRTFLIGPILAAAFKKGTLLLTVGFRDEIGLLQLPMFRMGKDTLYQCYATIIQKLRTIQNSKAVTAK